MKILAPIRSAEEVEMLVHTGADELYCGLVPQSGSTGSARPSRSTAGSRDRPTWKPSRR